LSRSLGRAGPLAISALGAILTAALGAVLTDLGPWYVQLHKPSWQPPDLLFGPAWTTIFTLCAIAAAKAWSKTGSRSARLKMLSLFVANMALNTLWSVLFFTLRRPDWALIEVAGLWLSIVVLIRELARHSRGAAWLLAPYLAWVTFASVLNLTIVRLNPSFG